MTQVDKEVHGEEGTDFVWLQEVPWWWDECMWRAAIISEQRPWDIHEQSE